jgi:hypothetical protein
MKKIVFLELKIYESILKLGAHHIADLFHKKGWEVNWVVSPISLFNLIKRKSGRREEIYYRLKNFCSSPNKKSIKYNLNEYFPFTLLPFKAGYPIFNQKIMGIVSVVFSLYPSFLKLKKNLANTDILWLNYPELWYYYCSIPAKVKVFRVVDDYTFLSDYKNWIEKLIMDESDVVFVCSLQYMKKLTEKYPYHGNKISYLPNGVNFEHFNQQYEEPSDFKYIPHPRAIYVGSIDYWFDKDMLIHAALKSPDIQFILVGPNRINLNGIKKFKNIWFIGQRSFNIIPAYLQHSDVGIIPFKTNLDLVDAISPLKLYEYFACGLPAVVSRWKELELIKPPCFIANDYESFSTLLRKALQQKITIKESLIKYAYDNRWNNRFNTIKKVLKTVM